MRRGLFDAPSGGIKRDSAGPLDSGYSPMMTGCFAELRRDGPALSLEGAPRRADRVKLWPFGKREPERRQSVPFTDAVVSALAAQAGGAAIGDASALAALEAAVALYSRAFAAAKVAPTVAALSPGCMALIARNLIRRGEDVHQLMLDGAAIRLQPIGSWDVRGGPRESDWWYRVDEFGPSGNLTHFVPAAAVLHVRYSVDSARPWHGIGPLGWARSTGTLAANLETRLGEEAGGPVGHVLPVPGDGGDGTDDDPLKSFKADLAGAKGRTILAETTSAGWGDGKTGAPQADYKAKRYGATRPRHSELAH